MGAAYELSRTHRVTLFEAEPRLGGHARTIMAGKRGDQPVDTGFLVFNYANYPLLTGLFDELGVPVTKSQMSFGASIAGGKLEYGLSSLGALFAQRRNALNPAYLKMIRDILHFNKHGLQLAWENPSLTIGEFLQMLGTGRYFRDYYLLPFSGAIWSTPVAKIMDFPAYAMMQFFENHALLNATGQHQWYTVEGGSAQYVSRLQAALAARAVDVRFAPVRSVTRDGGSVQIKVDGAEWQSFDEVIFATHSDDTLAMLGDPSAQERNALGAIRYQPNDVVLHCDPNVMPNSRKVWSSWNYTEVDGPLVDQIDLTYWINSLQPIPQDDPHFVTLNSRREIREECIYDQTVMRHPVYDLGAMAAQKEVAEFNGTRNTWFCGAWMKNGFHEDGLSSGIDVANAILKDSALEVAAE